MGNALKEQGKLEEALKAFKKALAINPDYFSANYNKAIILQEIGRLEEALKSYTKAVLLKPSFSEAYYNMGNIFKDLGKLGKAIEAYKNALEIKPDYESAKHILSALVGDTPANAPKEYVEQLFDSYAKRFEVSLVDTLDYQIPSLIKDILIQTNINESLGSVLDLGCGTGLLGLEIEGFCTYLEGIDLSNKMLGLASQKNIYDKLTKTDILDYLSGSSMNFDYFIAADVFVYIGDLYEIFHLIKSRSKNPGKLVFSTEHTEKDGYHLLKTGRFSHSKSYILNLCKQFDYKMSHFSTNKLRKEKGSFLTGGLYVLEFTQTI
jgi:predicted TPR repeat methyltransferase